jgi:ATP-dependent RNA helicase DeaD
VAITLAEPREHRLLRNIEQLTKTRIEVATLPTAMDVRARRLDMTRASLRAALEAGALDGFRVVTEDLASEFDPLDVAAAAVKLAHEALQGPAAENDEEHIPSLPAPRDAVSGKSGRGGKQSAGRSAGNDGDAGFGKPPFKKTHSRSSARGGGTMVRLWVSLGRMAGVRPADLVGAIANEAGVSARDIGAIEIEDRFCLVEVSDHIAEQAVQALRATSLRGQRVVVRRDPSRGGARPDDTPPGQTKGGAAGAAEGDRGAVSRKPFKSPRAPVPSRSFKSARPARP